MSVFCKNGIDVIDVKAPNGKPSILFSSLLEATEGNQDQALAIYLKTQSSEFKNWFGESKVVDENGEPMVVYHGTQANISTFGVGIHVGTKEQAQMRVLDGMDREGTYDQPENYMPLFVNGKNLKRVDDQGYDWSSVTAQAKEEGYDGIVYANQVESHGKVKGDSYLLFEPSQVKSIFNEGMFDVNNNNIHYQKASIIGGMVTAETQAMDDANPTPEEHAAQQMSGEVGVDSSSDVTKLINEARDVLNRQIVIYQARITSNKTAERAKLAERLQRLKELYDALSGSKNVEALEQFIKMANRTSKTASDQMTEVRKNLDDPTKLHSNIKTLVALNEFVASYNILDSVATALRRGNIKFEDDSIAIELAQAVTHRDGVQQDYADYGVPLLAEWLTDGYNGTVNEKVMEEFKIKIARVRNNLSLDGATKANKIAELEARRDRMLYTKKTVEQELRRASKDVGSLSLWLDPAIQSGDKAIELFAKIIKDKLYEANNKDRAYEEKLGNLYEKFIKSVGSTGNQAAKLFDSMLEEVKVLKVRRVKQPDGTYKRERYFKTELQYVSEVDYNAYNENRMNFLNSLPSNKAEQAKRVNMERVWYNEHTTIIEDVDEIIRERQEIMTDDEYVKWKRWNFITDKDGNLLGYKGELVEPKKSKYRNAKYDTIKSNSAAFDFFNAVVEQHMESQKLLPPKDQIGMKVPSIRKGDFDRAQEQGVWSSVKEAVSDATSFQATDTQYGLQSLSGESAKTVPVFYTNDIDLKDQSRDILQMTLKFNQMVNRYDALADIHGEVNLIKDVIGNRDYTENNSKGQAIMDAASAKIGLKRAQKKDASENKRASNAYKRLSAFIDMVYYGEEQKKQVLNLFGRDINIGKVADSLMRYASANSLIGNFLSGINNVVYGNAMIFTEAMAGQYFNGASHAKGKALYYSHLPDFIRDFGKTHGKSKVTLLVEYFDAMQGNFRTTYGQNVTGGIAKKLFSSDTLFWTQNKGEHEMQVSTMLMMLDHVKVKDKNGKEMTLFEAYEVVDGQLQIKQGIEFTKKEETLLRNKLHYVNRSLHGNYSDIDKAVIQRVAQGRLALMFRKFVAPGVKRRWKGLDSNIESDDLQEGFYITFGRLIREDLQELKAFLMMRQNTLTETEKRNIRRAIAEIGTFLTVTVALALVGYGDEDDDDEKEAKWKYYVMYELRRMQAELSFYWNPIEAYRILRTPTATMSTVERLFRFVDQFALTYDPDKLEYKQNSGLNKKGDNKSWAYFQSLVPALSGVRKSLSPEEAIKFFN
jgi:hypothetical protein